MQRFSRLSYTLQKFANCSLNITLKIAHTTSHSKIRTKCETTFLEQILKWTETVATKIKNSIVHRTILSLLWDLWLETFYMEGIILYRLEGITLKRGYISVKRVQFCKEGIIIYGGNLIVCPEPALMKYKTFLSNNLFWSPPYSEGSFEDVFYSCN